MTRSSSLGLVLSSSDSRRAELKNALFGTGHDPSSFFRLSFFVIWIWIESFFALVNFLRFESSDGVFRNRNRIGSSPFL